MKMASKNRPFISVLWTALLATYAIFMKNTYFILSIKMSLTNIYMCLWLDVLLIKMLKVQELLTSRRNVLSISVFVEQNSV